MPDQNLIIDRTVVRFFYSLIQSAVLEQPLQLKTEIPDINTIFHYAHINSISGLLYYSIFLNDLPIEYELDQRWRKELYETVYYNLSLQEYWKELKQKLDKLGVNYIPVKGAVIQKYYPNLGMRTMSDYDILYRYGQDEQRGLDSRSAQKIRSLHGQEGIEVISEGGIVDSIYMGKQILFEMHREFLGSDQSGYEYYHHIWDLCTPTDNPHEFQLSDSEQFILMLVHSHKHYSSAGCGPKELIDYYIVKHCSSVSLDWGYIHKVLDQLCLRSYENLLDRLTSIIFENLPGTNEDWKELEKWLKAGTYGNAERGLNNQITEYTSQGYSQSKAKLIYLLRRLYPPKEFVKDQFPLFDTYPVLIPILPVYRILKNRKGIMKKIRNELELLYKANSE